MREDVRKQILAQIHSASGATSPRRLTAPAAVQVGQVRKLLAYDNDRDSMLVLVVGVDYSRATATVVVTSSPAEHATKRDIILRRDVTGFPFETVVMVDIIAKVWITQLDGTRMVGSLPGQFCDFASTAHRLPSDELASGAQEIGAEIGALEPHVGDHMWWLRGQTAEHLAKLSDSCHQASLAPVVADPAIVSTLIARGATADWAATIALVDACNAEEVIVTDETLMSSATALSTTRTSPDVLRFIQGHFMDEVLRASSVEHDSPRTSSAETYHSLPKRSIPIHLGDDPLLELVSNAVDHGEAGTHIWTSAHLWAEEKSVSHLVVNGIRHPLLAQFDARHEETV